MLEGMEVTFIVIALGEGMLGAASLGAVAPLLVVILIGLALHRPLTSVPENTPKLVIRAMLSAFGTFWLAEELTALAGRPLGAANSRARLPWRWPWRSSGVIPSDAGCFSPGSPSFRLVPPARQVHRP